MFLAVLAGYGYVAIVRPLTALAASRALLAAIVAGLLVEYRVDAPI